MIIEQNNNTALIIMEDGENLIDNLKNIREQVKETPFLTVVTALGMLKKVKTGYWNGSEYEIHEIREPAELLGISGIVTPNTNPFYHFHIVLGTRDGTVKGGHLLEATVCNTLEMLLVKQDYRTKRVQIGNLKVLKMEE